MGLHREPDAPICGPRLLERRGRLIPLSWWRRSSERDPDLDVWPRSP
jgi:hypothetical protein